MEVHERIRELRETKGLSQENIADMLNETQSGYSKIELGKKKLKIENLIKLAEMFNTSTDYILGLDSKTEKKTIIKNEIDNIIKELEKRKTEL